MSILFSNNTYRDSLGCTLFGQERARNSLKASQITSMQGSQEGQGQGFFEGWMKEEIRRLEFRRFSREPVRTLRDQYEQMLAHNDEKLLCEFLKAHPEALVLLLADNRLKDDGKAYILDKLPEVCVRAAFDHVNRADETIKAKVEPLLKSALDNKDKQAYSKAVASKGAEMQEIFAPSPYISQRVGG